MNLRTRMRSDLQSDYFSHLYTHTYVIRLQPFVGLSPRSMTGLQLHHIIPPFIHEYTHKGPYKSSLLLIIFELTVILRFHDTVEPNSEWPGAVLSLFSKRKSLTFSLKCRKLPGYTAQTPDGDNSIQYTMNIRHKPHTSQAFFSMGSALNISKR